MKELGTIPQKDVLKLQAYDAKAWNTIYPHLFRILMNKLQYRNYRKSHAEIEDLAQDSLVRLYEEIKGHNSEKFKLEQFLFTILRSITIDHSRRLSNRLEHVPLELLEEKLSAEEVPVEENIDRAELLGEIQDLIRELPPNQMATIQLLFGEELTHDEAAERLGVTRGAIKSLRIRAIVFLKDKLLRESALPNSQD